MLSKDRSKTTSGFFVNPILSQLWEEKNYCERRNELSWWRPVAIPNHLLHLCLWKLGYEVLALISSDIYILSGENIAGVYSSTRRRRDQRPYLINFDATGSPCHELTSWDNSSSMSIWLGRKESHCEDILPVSSTDGAAISPTISLALSLWYTRKCEIKENLSGVLLLHVKLRNTK